MTPPETLTPLHPRSRESFRFAKMVSLPYGDIERVLEWCKNQSHPEGWRWQLVQSSSPQHAGRYCFFFDHEEDYAAFLLKWA